MEDRGRNKPIKTTHEVMEACLRENVPTIQECYIGPLCSKSTNAFSLEKRYYGRTYAYSAIV